MQIVQGLDTFKRSENDDDWLGHGIYFWEYAPQQAWRWAERRYAGRREPIAVLAAMIRLGNCFDLLDPLNARTLLRFNHDMTRTLKEAGQRVPQNYNARKRLDCATLQFAYAALEQEGEPVDTCRAVYVPTSGKDRLWERSWLYHETHIQLCVRSPACILGCWLARMDEES